MKNSYIFQNKKTFNEENSIAFHFANLFNIWLNRT